MPGSEEIRSIQHQQIETYVDLSSPVLSAEMPEQLPLPTRAVIKRSDNFGIICNIQT